MSAPTQVRLLKPGIRNGRTCTPWVGAMLVLALAACTGTPAVKAYKATAYTVHSVKTAMLVFNDEYQAGKFSEQDRLNVIEVYEKYRSGMKLAIKAQKVALDAQGVPLDNVVLQGELQSLAADVIAFIEGLRKGKAP